ncbi:1834_t:CDS:1, partial [Racocetra fulgida]
IPTPNNNLLSLKLDDLSDIDMNSPIFDSDLFNDWADFFSNQNTYPSPDLSITSSSNSSPSPNNLNNFDLPIQVDQQVNNDQYELGIFDFSNVNINVNEISEINSHNLHEIFDIQNNCILDDLANSNGQLPFLPNLLNTTINQNNLNDALIAYEI